MNEITQLKLEGVDYFVPLSTGVQKSILENITIDIKSQSHRNSFTSIIAPFGSGKSTLLKIISGSLTPTKGQIKFYNDSGISQIPKAVLINEHKNYLSWLSVKKNIEFTIENSRYTGKKSNSDIQNIIDLVGLNGYEDHIPNSKSKGFIFRISIGNALITNPDFILLDEPFRNFTSSLRSEVYQVLQDIKSNTKVNFILATTNILESIHFSDMVYMMQKNPGLIFDSLEIDRSKISAWPDINEYTKKIIMEIQNRFAAKKNLEIINFSI